MPRNIPVRPEGRSPHPTAHGKAASLLMRPCHCPPWALRKGGGPREGGPRDGGAAGREGHATPRAGPGDGFPVWRGPSVLLRAPGGGPPGAAPQAPCRPPRGIRAAGSAAGGATALPAVLLPASGCVWGASGSFGSVRSRLQLTFNTVLVSGARHNGRTFL